MATIKGIAYYASVQSAKTKYQKEGSKDPLDLEYTIDILVDPTTHKEFGKKFKKQKKDPITKEEFVKVYKMEPPAEAKTNADGEYCIIKLKTNYAYEDFKTKQVKIMGKPKVLFPNPATGKLVEDTETLIGNGSEVMVQYIEYENKKWKTLSAKLKAVRVDTLVPYGDDSLDELGEIDQDSLVDSSGELEQGFSDAPEDDDTPFDTDEDDDVY